MSSMPMVVGPTDAAVEEQDDTLEQPDEENLDALQQGIVEETLAQREHFFDIEQHQDIETTITTIGSEIDMAELGLEVAGGQQLRLEHWLEQGKEYQDKTLDQLAAGTEEERQLAQVMIMATTHRIIGSVWRYHIFAQTDVANMNWEADGFAIEAIEQAVKPDLADVQQIPRDYLDASEQELLTFLQGESMLAESIRKRYATMLEEEHKNITGLMKYYTYTFLGKSEPEQEAEKGYVGRKLDQAKQELASLADPDLSTKEKAKIVGKYGLIAAAGGVVLRRIFKDRKEDADGNKKGMSRRKKALIAVGLGGAAFWLFKERDKNKKDKEPNDKVDGGSPGDVPSQAEAIDFERVVPTHEQIRATTAADAMNSLFVSTPDRFGGSSFEQGETMGKEVKGVLFGILQARYGSVGALLHPNTYGKEYVGANIQKFYDTLKTFSLQHIQTLGKWILSFVGDGLVGQFLAKKGEQEAVDFLQQHVTQTHLLEHVFRKQISVMSYLHYKQYHLEQAIAAKQLAEEHGEDREGYDANKQADLIEDFLNDAALYERHVAQVITAYRSAPIIHIDDKTSGASGLAILENYGILNDSVGPLEVEVVEQIDEEMNELIDYDPDTGTSLFSNAFEGGQLTTDGKEQYEQVTKNVLKHYEELGERNFLDSWAPILGLFDHDDETIRQLIQMYEGVMSPIVDQIEERKTKLAEGSFTLTDAEQCQQTVMYYRDYMRQLAFTRHAVTDMKETQGGGWVTIENTMGFAGHMRNNTKDGLGSIGHGIKLIFTGDGREKAKSALHVGSGLFELAGVAASAAPALLAVEFFSWPFRLPFAWRQGKRAPRAPIVVKAGAKMLKWGVKKSGMLGARGIRRVFNPSFMYRGKFELLKLDLAAGRMSFDQAARIAQRNKVVITTAYGEKVVSSGDEMTRLLLGKKLTDDEVRIIQKYWSHDALRKQLVNRDSLVSRWKFRARNAPDKQLYSLASKPTLDALVDIDRTIGALVDPTEQRILTRFLTRSKDVSNVHTIMSQWSTIRIHMQLNATGGVEQFLKIWKLQPKQMADLLSTIDDVNDIPQIMKFLQQATKGGHIQAGHETRYIRSVFKQRSILKTQLPPSTQLFTSLNKVRLARGVERVVAPLGPKLAKLAEVANDAKKTLGLMLANKTLPPNTKAYIQRVMGFMDDIGQRPAAFAHAMNGLGAKIQGVLPEASVAHINSMKTFMKSHPKLMKGLGVVTVAILGGVNVYFSIQESKEYRGVNDEWSDLYAHKAFREGLLTMAGMALVFIPGIGALILGAIEGIAWVANDAYVEVMKAYATNLENWKKKGIEAKQEAMQHIMSIMAGEHDIERSNAESFTRWVSVQHKSIFTLDADQTTRDALTAWILFDEIEKDPTQLGASVIIGGLRIEDIIHNMEDEGGIVSESDKAAMIDTINNIKRRVAARVAYIEQKVGMTTIDVKRRKTREVWHGNSMGLEVYYEHDTATVLNLAGSVEQYAKGGNLHSFFIQLASESAFANNPNECLRNPQEVVLMREEIANRVHAKPILKENMLALWHDDRQYFLHMVRGALLYGQHMQGSTPEEKLLIEQHITYIQDMIAWISIETGQDIQYILQQNTHTAYDYGLIHQFVLTLDYQQGAPTSLDGQDEQIAKRDDARMREHFQRSPNVLENVLYDIATEVYGMHIDNTPEDLQRVFTEERGEQHGVYLYDMGNRFGVTDTDRRDKTTGMSLEEQLTAIRDMRVFILSQIKDNDLIDTQTGSGEQLINNEVGGKILRIFQRYFDRLRVRDGEQIVTNYDGILFAIEQCSCEVTGKWFYLPLDVVATAMMLGLEDIGSYAFRLHPDGYYETIKDDKIVPLPSLYPQLGLPSVSQEKVRA